MNWYKITIDTTTEAEELLGYELQEMGMSGVEIEDHVPLTEEERKIMYVDLLPDEIAPDDGTARVSCYIEQDRDPEEAMEMVREKIRELSAFINVGRGTISLSETKEEDWVNNWKAYFKPFRLDDNIVIKPTWETLEDSREGDIIVEIDPGTAFGSGSHETTQLCISQLKKYASPSLSLLDLGTGSGILSIIALKLGFGEADATDIDPNAIRATKENIEVNGIPESLLRVYQANLLDQEEAEAFYEKTGRKRYDVVVANILADVIIPLTSIVPSLLKEDGVFIASGIIDTMEEPVKEAFKAGGFEILEVHHQKDWVSVTGRPGKDRQ